MPHQRPQQHDVPIDGVSDLPGTVDVSTAVFSKVRGDGIFNPRPIPSLVGTAFEAAYGHEAKETSLANFIRGVEVEEFQGDEPDPKLFDALVAYVRALDPAAALGDGTGDHAQVRHERHGSRRGGPRYRARAR